MTIWGKIAGGEDREGGRKSRGKKVHPSKAVSWKTTGGNNEIKPRKRDLLYCFEMRH